jgi:hypothetical protein
MPQKTEKEEIVILKGRIGSLEHRVSQDYAANAKYVEKLVQRVTELENK